MHQPHGTAPTPALDAPPPHPAAPLPPDVPVLSSASVSFDALDGPGVSVTQLFEAAVRLHSRRLFAIARAIVGGAGGRASPEDVVQQALTNLYQHRDRYDWQAPLQAGALLRRAVVNEALRLMRQPRMGLVADDYPDAVAQGRRGGGAPGSADPASGMIDRETVDRVRAAIARLPEHFRAALVLCEYEAMPYAQIAEVLGASIPQVKTWLHRGRRQLAELLKDFAEPSDTKAANQPGAAKATTMATPFAPHLGVGPKGRFPGPNDAGDDVRDVDPDVVPSQAPA